MSRAFTPTAYIKIENAFASFPLISVTQTDPHFFHVLMLTYHVG